MAEDKRTPDEVIVFGLIENILGTLKQSGATMEQSMAALQSVEAILPVADFQSLTKTTVRVRA